MSTTITLDDLRDLIAKTDREIAAAAKIVADKQAFMRDLEATQRVLAVVNGGDMQVADSANQMSADYRAGTNKAFIYEALRSLPAVWSTANEIQVKASELKGESIPMSSISPSLTEMKEDGIVVRDGLKVALMSRSGGIVTAHIAQPGSLRTPTSAEVVEALLGNTKQEAPV